MGVNIGVRWKIVTFTVTDFEVLFRGEEMDEVDLIQARIRFLALQSLYFPDSPPVVLNMDADGDEID